MCVHLYEKWCDSMMSTTDVTQLLQWSPYFNKNYAQQNMEHLATLLGWSCECIHDEEPPCCVHSNEIIDYQVNEIVCSNCGVVRHYESHSFKDQSFYFSCNGNIQFRSHYSAEKNFKKFLACFQYPITIFISHKDLKDIQKFVEKTPDEEKLFLFLKHKKLSHIYEYIPRLIKNEEVEVLTDNEVQYLQQEYRNFCTFYSTFRQTKSRKSLPHRGFLFQKFCERIHIYRFHPYIRLPKLHHTVQNLNKIWMEYEQK